LGPIRPSICIRSDCLTILPFLLHVFGIGEEELVTKRSVLGLFGYACIFLVSYQSEFVMRYLRSLTLAMAAGTMMLGSALAQQTGANETTSKQKTDGNSPTVVGPASGAYKQHTDGNSPTVVGPASGAYKQHTDGASPTMVGPASGAYKNQ
jgi:hypothetical protein